MHMPLERASIRSWQPADVDALVRHADDREIWRQVRDAFPHPYTREHAQRWIAQASGARPETQFAIEVDGQAGGGIGVVLGEDIFRRSAQLGYWIGRAFWGRGIVTSAVRALTAWAFASFDLCRVEAFVFETNAASMRVLEKAGYRLECRHSKAVTKDGVTMDDYLYVTIRE